MTDRSCRDFAEARSAYVDGHLGEAERQRLLRHLSDCSSCRQDLAELRRLRARLTWSGEAGVPVDLSARLASIGDTPLPPADSPAPSRGGHRRTLSVSAAGAVILLALITGVGYVAAPSDAATGRRIDDPIGSVRAEFSAALTQVPMASYAIAAALLVDPARLTVRDAQLPDDPTMTGPALTTDQLADLLTRAEWASSRVAHSGVAQVVAPRDDRITAAEVDIDFTPGRGSEVAVRTLSGQQLTDGLLATPPASRITGADLITELSTSYQVSGTGGGTLLGRPVTQIEVRRAGEEATLAARWWIDDRTGLTLRQQTYDHAGRLILSAGYTELQIGPAEDDTQLRALAGESAPLTSPLTTAAFTTSSAGELASQGWSCHDRLAGMALARLRADAPAEPGVLHMIYTDGMSTVSVVQRRGSLHNPPSESEWDPSIAAFRDDAIVNTATWQSGGAVFTVATDGSPALRNRVVAALPHEAPAERTTMERIRAGWSRILDIGVG